MAPLLLRHAPEQSVALVSAVRVAGRPVSTAASTCSLVWQLLASSWSAIRAKPVTSAESAGRQVTYPLFSLSLRDEASLVLLARRRCTDEWVRRPSVWLGLFV